jgi:lipopolysaccharide/colanic/teichoic acid biosynthesis glycosyltransferase
MTRLSAKRCFDIFFAGLGLLVLSPLLLVIAALVKWGDGGPVFFRQRRVGLGGSFFWIWKFRTMVVDAEKKGLKVTGGSDPRVTPVGRILRRTKLDELPQLWNVLRGDMSFVGPRPEVPRYVAFYTPEQREILKLKPGITDLATLEFRNEEELLRHAADVERFYIDCCIPRKIELNLLYTERANVWQDTLIILQTLMPWWQARRAQRINARNHNSARKSRSQNPPCSAPAPVQRSWRRTD